MSKMSEIDQIHLRAVMLCMSKMLKMRKEHTNIFLLLTDGLNYAVYVGDVKDMQTCFCS